MKSMKENKEDGVRKTLDSQVLISTRVGNLEDRKVLISLQLRLPVVRLFYRHHQLQVYQEVLQEHRLLLTAHIVGGSIKESVRD